MEMETETFEERKLRVIRLLQSVARSEWSSWWMEKPGRGCGNRSSHRTGWTRPFLLRVQGNPATPRFATRRSRTRTRRTLQPAGPCFRLWWLTQRPCCPGRASSRRSATRCGRGKDQGRQGQVAHAGVPPGLGLSVGDGRSRIASARRPPDSRSRFRPPWGTTRRELVVVAGCRALELRKVLGKGMGCSAHLPRR